MENIIDKLRKKDANPNWGDWSSTEIKQLLDIYLVISKKEAQLFDLIYSFHGCDSWEEIFRDYDMDYLEYKTSGIEVALDELSQQIKKSKPK